MENHIVSREIDPTVYQLIKLGFTKWKIAAFVYGKENAQKGWRNVHAWASGFYSPNELHKTKLEQMLRQAEHKDLSAK